MPPIPSELRSHLERTVIAAREVAAARGAPSAAVAGIQRCPTKLLATTQTRYPL